LTETTQNNTTNNEGGSKNWVGRPEDPRVATTITEAEIWRGNIVREIIKKVSDIQNGSLGEYRIRELNDRINELLREKAIWEERVSQLGGSNYAQRREEE
jgi:pre-mRNA-splicing factor ISY1